ncbi:amidohydrolase [Streptomyces sp. NPDC001307]|uniref:amidohydrolase n=1 Tax=Streptomyces sp. NPDC001307 TaxID=3364560 RepID=UPI003683CEA7
MSPTTSRPESFGGGRAPHVAYVNGRVWTGEPAHPWAQGLLVAGADLVAVGTDEEIRAVAPAGADVIDLGGRMVMPGIHDAHIHLLFSGLKFRYECRLENGAEAPRILRSLADCGCAGHGLPERGGWVVGGEINPNVFPDAAPDRAWLDEAYPDRPIFLYDYTIHHGFANARALELAGIDATTPDPHGGRILRRPDTGEPTGELVERATWAVQRAIPDFSPAVYREAVRWAVSVANRYGITSVQEASASGQELQALGELDAADELTVHVAAHLVWREEGFGMADAELLEERIRDRARYASLHVRTDFVKLWLDGAPLPPHYTHAGIGPDDTVDDTWLVVPPGELCEALGRFDREGLTVKIHCAAEGSVRVALDAIEAVRKANGPDGPVHEVAHCCFIHPDDLARFSALNAVAEMSPALWHRPEPEFAGLKKGYKFATLRRMGARVTVGSNWIITENPNLFPALQGLLEHGEEKVDLATALHLMTLAGAEAVGMAERIGSLRPGKSADFIVLDRNLFRVPVAEVGATEVLLTVFEGRPVYRAADSL